jgi:hypothetical protein
MHGYDGGSLQNVKWNDQTLTLRTLTVLKLPYLFLGYQALKKSLSPSMTIEHKMQGLVKVIDKFS